MTWKLTRQGWISQNNKIMLKKGLSRLRLRRPSHAPPSQPIGHWRRYPLVADREFGFNEKSEGCANEAWTIIKKMHLNLGHTRPEALARVFRHMGATPEVQQFAKNLRCRICEEIVRPALTRTARLPEFTRFNECIYFDEFEVVLSDDSRVLCIMVEDAASNYTVVIPTEAVRMVTS